MDISQSTIFLTGAAGGIGACILKALLQANARKIYAADLRVADIDAHPAIVPVRLDITDDEAARRVAAAAPDTTILINCAGVNLRSRFLGSPTLDQARREMETNYFGTLAMCRAFAPVLAHHPGQAAIVNMLSVLSRVTLPNVGTYCASKAALLSLTEGIRIELRPQGVRVIGIFPWAVATAMSGPFEGAKVGPEAVAASLVDAIEQERDEAFIHPFSADIDTRLVTDARTLQDALAV
jgi:NAD(P)-dependent dehydrogenase (short-subunit alcohol dehydrogenase family)